MCLSPKWIRTPESDLGIFNSAQEFIKIPCGKCDECRTSHSKEWALRCMCEYYSLDEDVQDRCWFLTFTYDEVHVPKKLKSKGKNDMTLFLKRLRKCLSGYKIKYFYCGEYGTKTLRPHYHMIVYNLPLDGLKFYKRDMLKSDFLQNLWGKGIVTVQQVTFASCNYVARYCLKKNNSDCFQRCSQGLGKIFFYENMMQIASEGYIAIPYGDKIIKCPIPRYFRKLYRNVIGDRMYAKWLKHRNKSVKEFNELVNSSYKSPVNDNMIWLNRLRLGSETPSEKMYREGRKLVNQALYDFYHVRDLR